MANPAERRFLNLDKKGLHQEALFQLRERLQVLVAAAFEAREASINPESKAENKYDTRGLEASYLAAGQSQRAAELKKALFHVERLSFDAQSGESIRVGSLVHILIEEEEDKFYFLLPIGGLNLGETETPVQALGAESPLARELIGKKAGDEFDFKNRGYEILGVR
jgi:transcription elongation GreA/GreB family factor